MGGRAHEFRSAQGVVAWRRSDELSLVLASESALPVVDIDIGLEVGSLHDPSHKEGLARLTAKLMRMGPRRMRPEAFDDAIARLGARFGVEVAPRSIRFRATVLRRNAAELLALLGRVLDDPALRPADLRRVKRETEAAFGARLDNDQALAVVHFRKGLFNGHPYGRPSAGDRWSVGSIRHQDVCRFYEKYIRRARRVIGIAGDIDRDEVDALIDQHFPASRARSISPIVVPAPKRLKGRHLLLVDKPDRAQTQLIIGTLSLRTRDPLLFPLVVSNAAFGGSMSARLMQEVRAKRGWSYGAYSHLLHEQQRDAWYMWSFPSAEYAAECAALELDLLDKWCAGGISAAECSLAKRSLINGRCFDIDTPAKRLDAQMDIRLHGTPAKYVNDFEACVRRVTRASANKATAQRLSSEDLLITIVASASELAPALEKLPGLASVHVVPYSDEPSSTHPR